MQIYKNMEEKIFKTSDFYTAAFLLSQGFKLITLNRENPHRVFFVFEDKAGREKLIEDFFHSEVVIEPRKFITAIKELKSLIYSDALR